MASLSRIVKEKSKLEEKHQANVIVQDLTIEDVKPLTIEAPMNCEDKYKCVMFLSDTALTSTVREQLREFKNVREFDAQRFANRDLDTLHEQHGIDYVWCNLKDKGCRNWVATQLPKQSAHFKCISVYSHTKGAKWRTDVEPYCDHSCKLSNLKDQLMALSFGELAQNFDKLDLHEVPNQILSFCGLQGKLTKKKRVR
jgi:hypothetical protein